VAQSPGSEMETNILYEAGRYIKCSPITDRPVINVARYNFFKMKQNIKKM
jgi:hypothetical protein